MGIDSKLLRENVRSKMAKEDRKAIGVSTDAEVIAKNDLMAEREQHETFEQWLRLNQIPYIHSRMDRKSTIREGWPDFTICHGNGCVLIEFKSGSNEPTTEQLAVIAELKRANVPAWVCWSVDAAIVVVKETLKI